MRKRLLIATGAAALLVAAPALAEKSNDTLRVGFNETIKTADSDYDPKPESRFTGTAVFDTLITFDPHDKAFKPLLAKSWKRVNPTTIEFKLRSDVKWHDGQAFDADDVVYTVKYHLNPKTKYRFRRNIMFMKTAEKVDQHTVRLIAKRPMAIDLVRYAVSLRMSPQHVHSQFKVPSDFGRKNPIGTGPYKVASLSVKKGVVLVRSKHYVHGDKAGIKAHIGRMEGIPIADIQTQVAQLMTGGLDLLHGVPKDLAERLHKDPRFKMTASQGLVYFYFSLDAVGRSKLKVFKDQRVRKAVMMAIDRQSLAKNVISGGSEVRVIDTVCFPVQFGCHSTKKPVGFDPAAAKKLLAQAGFPNGFELEITALSGAREVAEAIAGQLRKIGVRSSVDYLTFGAYRKKQRAGKLQALSGRYSSGGLPDASALTNFYFGGGPRDYWRDPLLSKLRKDGNKQLPLAKRRAIFAQAMDRMNEMNYILPLATNPAVFVHTKDIKVRKGSLHNYGIDIHDVSWN